MVDQLPEIDLRIWGKSKGLPAPYPVIWHLVDTAAIAGMLWDRHLSVSQRRVIASGLSTDEQHARSLVMFWAGLHDVGKSTPGFQVKDGQAFARLVEDPQFAAARDKYELGHDRATHLALPALLNDMGYPVLMVRSSSPGFRVGQILGGHHGRFCEFNPRDPGARRVGQAGWAAQRAAMTSALYTACGRPKAPANVGDLASVLIAGVVVLADWLASQDHFVQRQLPLVPAEATEATVTAHLVALQPTASGLLDEAGLTAPRLRTLGFEECFPFAPNALQVSVRDELLGRLSGPGLLLVTAATGDGKTEVALTAARALADVCGANGFYFALPTMATSDEMYRRIRSFATKIADGPAPVTLLHSMSWLNAEYESRTQAGLEDPDVVGTVPDDPETHVTATDWLRGRRRGLLAALSVGTVDQALIAVLATKHNALRMLGLSGKVFVVDEAHSYDDYMQALLQRLLTWLGACRAPVVLLSATLPEQLAQRLIAAYERGSGRPSNDPFRMEYPGWSFVPASHDQPTVTISPQARAEVIAGRSIKLDVELRPVRHIGAAGPTAGPLDRWSALREVLAPLAESGGAAGVICNTVNDAQLTYLMIRRWLAGRAATVLLHSRFPAGQREEITDQIVGKLGRTGQRPNAMIVVATQVIEQSLDLDFDLVVSDLAPLAQLLQRAGRCYRHVRPRPAWSTGPRLVVLDPHGEQGYQPPFGWGAVYARYLLRATHHRLAAINRILVPDDVQEHMEAVYAPSSLDDPAMAREYEEYLGLTMASGQMARYVAIPEVQCGLGDLSVLSRSEVSEMDASTRLGADSVRVICCYLDAEGRQWLDPQRRCPVPQRGSRSHGRFTPDEVRAILRNSIPIRSTLIAGYEPLTAPPATWQDNVWLSELRQLWFTIGTDGPKPILHQGRTIYFDHNQGLVVARVDESPCLDDAVVPTDGVRRVP